VADCTHRVGHRRTVTGVLSTAELVRHLNSVRPHP
jgi:hypothetical protein